MPSSGIMAGTTDDGQQVNIGATNDGRVKVDIPAEEQGTDDLLRQVALEIQALRYVVCKTFNVVPFVRDAATQILEG
jgi:hypothetical protein